MSRLQIFVSLLFFTAFGMIGSSRDAHATMTTKIKSPTSGTTVAQNTPVAVLVNVAQVSAQGGTVIVTYLQGNLQVGSFSAPMAQGATTVSVSTTTPKLPNGENTQDYTVTAQAYNPQGDPVGEADSITLTVINNN